MTPKKTDIPLRERKKEAIRSARTASARKLFEKYKYEDVTLEAIAEEASFHVQTLYRHFKNKVNLALAIDIFGHEGITKLLMDANRTEDILTVWRKDRQGYFTGVINPGQKREFLQLGEMIDSVPALKAQSLARWKKTETLLAVNIAKDTGKNLDEDMFPRLLASMLVSSHLEVLRRWAKSKGRLDARQLYEDTLDDIEYLFAGAGDAR